MTLAPTVYAGKKIGLLGGSFNPSHEAHVQISDVAYHRLGLDQLWWLVTPGNPLKDPKDYLPFEERMARAKTITKGRPWLRVSDLECHLGSSYTAETLTTLTRRYRGTQFVWIMGGDNLKGFHRWNHWEQIPSTVPICVISRPGAEMEPLKSVAARTLADRRIPMSDARGLTRYALPAWVYLPLVHNSISATAIRAAQKENRSGV